MKRRAILMGKAEHIATATEPVCPVVFTRQVLGPVTGKRPPDEGSSITPKCHRTAGVRVWYFPGPGRLLLTCAQCEAEVVWIQVANEAPQ
jgi:hypothetical protein